MIFGVRNDQKVSHNMILMSKYKRQDWSGVSIHHWNSSGSRQGRSDWVDRVCKRRPWWRGLEWFPSGEKHLFQDPTPSETQTKLRSQNVSYLWLSSSLAKVTSVMLSSFKEAVRYLKLHQSSLLSRDIVSCKVLSQLKQPKIATIKIDLYSYSPVLEHCSKIWCPLIQLSKNVQNRLCELG